MEYKWLRRIYIELAHPLKVHNFIGKGGYCSEMQQSTRAKSSFLASVICRFSSLDIFLIFERSPAEIIPQQIQRMKENIKSGF